MKVVTDAIRRDIITAIENNELLLPTLPEVALRVRDVAEHPDTDIDALADVIGQDTALTVRLIRIASSPLLGADRPTHDLKMALMRLGIDYACKLAISLAMEQMFQATSDIVDRRLREVWSHSREIAGICNALCKHRSTLEADKATLAGLVHKIGVLPILAYAEEHPSLLGDSITLDNVIDDIHPTIGEMILRNWEFPEELLQVPAQHLNFTRQAAAADYADLVTVAILHSYLGGTSPMGPVDYHKVTAFERLGLDPDMHAAEVKEPCHEV